MGSLSPYEQMVVVGGVSCGITVILIVLCLFPGLTELRMPRPRTGRDRRRAENRGRRSRHALGGSGAPEGAGGPSGDPEDQEIEEDPA